MLSFTWKFLLKKTFICLKTGVRSKSMMAKLHFKSYNSALAKQDSIEWD